MDAALQLVAVAATVVAKLGAAVFATAKDASAEQKFAAASKMKYVGYAAVAAGLGAAYLQLIILYLTHVLN